MPIVSKQRDTEISEATSWRVRRKAKTTLRHEMAAEIISRVRAGDVEVQPWDCIAGAATGGLFSALEAAWGMMPKGTDPSELMNVVGGLLPRIIADVGSVDSGDLVEEMGKIKKDAIARRTRGSH